MPAAPNASAKRRMNKTWPPALPQGFPLTIHPRGYMARIAGKPRWICGKIQPKEALKVYHQKAAALLAGMKPVAVRVGGRKIVTIKFILSSWIRDRQADALRGELTPGSLLQYRHSAKAIRDIVGHVAVTEYRPDHTRQLYGSLYQNRTADFAKRALGHFRTACNHAVEQGWCGPVNLGKAAIAKATSRPAVKMRWQLYTPDQIRIILDGLEKRIRGRNMPSMIQLRAMIYLALNGGYGAQELSDLPRSVIDLDKGRIDYRRGKTGKDHIVPLWPETIAALRPVLAQRKGDDLLFRTREGNPWCAARLKFSSGKPVGRYDTDNVNERFTALVKPMGLKIRGQGFYKLKHLANTTADECGDVHATFTLFGHSLPGTKAHYVRVGEDRVRRVVEYMRSHLLVPSRQADHHRPVPIPTAPALSRSPEIVSRPQSSPSDEIEVGYTE